MTSKYATYIRANWRPLAIAMAMAIMTAIVLVVIPGSPPHHSKPGPGVDITPQGPPAKDFSVGGGSHSR